MMFTKDTKYYIIIIQYTKYQNFDTKYETPNPNPALVSLSPPVECRQLPHKMTCHKPEDHHDYLSLSFQIDFLSFLKIE